ncbi:MAG: molecular chaperone DnaJ [Planctomycetes bacterium RBG_16_59_8]|nr:MAG: molecular chaperone DnaJ [Planctomycetes bacterium RBG_16_59_8]
MTVERKKDYYEVLGVAKAVSTEDLKKAYRRAALKYHPDRNPGDKEAEKKFKEAAEAYEVLGDPEQRKRYDQFGHDGLKGFSHRGFTSPEDIFEAFGDIFTDFGGGESVFGDFFGVGRRHRGPRKGASLRIELEVDFEEAAFGVEKSVELFRHERCETCGGNGCKPGTQPVNCNVCGGRGEVLRSQGFFSIRTTCGTCGGAGKAIQSPCSACRGAGQIRKKREITIKIPAGIEDSTRMRLSGEGESSPDGGPAGDLYCDVFVKDHPFFVRQGDDLYCEFPISFAQAALGAEVDVPSIKGKRTLKIPAGTASGQILRVKGEGVAHLGGGGRGDQLVRVIVHVPEKLTKRQEEILKEFETIENGKGNKKGFFTKFF